MYNNFNWLNLLLAIDMESTGNSNPDQRVGSRLLVDDSLTEDKLTLRKELLQSISHPNLRERRELNRALDLLDILRVYNADVAWRVANIFDKEEMLEQLELLSDQDRSNFLQTNPDRDEWPQYFIATIAKNEDVHFPTVYWIPYNSNRKVLYRKRKNE